MRRLSFGCGPMAGSALSAKAISVSVLSLPCHQSEDTCSPLDRRPSESGVTSLRRAAATGGVKNVGRRDSTTDFCSRVCIVLFATDSADDVAESFARTKDWVCSSAHEDGLASRTDNARYTIRAFAIEEEIVKH